MPINFLLIEALRKFHHYYGDDFRVECPTGSGTQLTLSQVADELARRLTNLSLRDKSNRRSALAPMMPATRTTSSSTSTSTTTQAKAWARGTKQAGPP